MLQDFLDRILIYVLALNVFTLGVLLVFLVNFRLNIRRRVLEREFALRMLMTIQRSQSSDEVSRQIGLPVAEITEYCKDRGIETPEERIARLDMLKKRKDDENRRIIEEEALWRAEQERLTMERQREKELETKKRRERLKKFGIV